MPARRIGVAALSALAFAAAGPTAVAGDASAARSKTKPKPKSIYHSKLLWATVNVCDTLRHPDTIGIRASMPGSGYADERMFMRIQVQYYSVRDNRWHNIGASGDSGWLALGSARYRARQAGRNFTLSPPPVNQAHIVRGAVTFEWRRDGEVVRRARKRTRSKQGRTRGADPAGYSVAKCEIR